jgi:hypothetical protein
MQLDAIAAIQRAFENHITNLVSVLLTSTSPYFTPTQNDDSIRRFEMGVKHTLGVYSLAITAVTNLIKNGGN